MDYKEKENLEKLRQGSPEAFEALFHKYGGKLYSFVMKISSHDSYMAEEMVQRAFVKVWENHSSVNPNKTFINFLCTIAKNMLMNEYEHQAIGYIYKNYILTNCSGIDNSTEGEINKLLLEEYIDSLIEKLPPARKRIFVMSRKEMLSNKEIADRLQLSESTIQTQLTKAVDFMKSCLAKHWGQIFILFFSLKCKNGIVKWIILTVYI